MSKTIDRKLDIEINKIIAETSKINEEIRKINQEIKYYPLVVAAGFGAGLVGLGILIARLIDV